MDTSGLIDSLAAMQLTREVLKNALAAKPVEPGQKPDDDLGPMTPSRLTLRKTNVRGLQRRWQHAIATPTPVAERWVNFWANHFCVASTKGTMIALVWPHEYEAIRPHAFGSFRELLRAAVVHPAMLLYLDNAQSIGPQSRAGNLRDKGLNENLAREILELHTVSPAAGYTQADVTEFAKVLTGWSIGRLDQAEEPGGAFMFRPFRHQPGAKLVMGQRFEEGLAGGLAALQWLATHPATCTHLATKLARHFIADAPPPHCVAALAAVLRDTGGDLAAVARALVRLPEAWAPLTKLRSPQDYVIAALRAVGAGPASGAAALAGFNQLGQPLWAAPGPNGWPDEAAAWVAPEALMRRAEFAWALAGRTVASGPGPARDMAAATLGPSARAETLTAIAQAGSEREALTLLLASPEFQRR